MKVDNPKAKDSNLNYARMSLSLFSFLFFCRHQITTIFPSSPSKRPENQYRICYITCPWERD